MAKIAAGIIIYNGNYVLQECLQSMYPHVDQILVAEGPVSYWQNKGAITSTDGTNEILDNFPDPENKISIIHGQFKEKEQQCNAYMPYLRKDIDYIWNIDSDELYKDEDWEKIKDILDKKKYTEVQFRFLSFYGGFDHYISGYEENVKTIRIQRIYPGATWKSHRPPRINPKKGFNDPINVLTHEDTDKMGIRIYHYSFCFANQVYQKMQYYQASVNKENCIPNYFQDVWLPWVLTSDDKEKRKIEEKWRGVQDCIRRSDAYTAKFEGTHPQIIQDNMSELEYKYGMQLLYYMSKNKKYDKMKEELCWYAKRRKEDRRE